MRSGTKAKRIVTNLFDAFMDEPRLLPPDYVVDEGGALQAVRIADYIAGMTDRYAMKEHMRLFAAHEA